MSLIALFGATGAMGRSVAEELRRRQMRYRVVGRSGAALEAAYRNDPLAERVTWDPADHASVRRAATGVDAVVHLLGGDYDRWHVLPQLTRAIVAGAEAAGVSRIVLAGSVYVYGRPRSARVAENHPRDANTRKGRVRVEQEDILVAADASGRIGSTILRLPDFYGPGVEKSLLHAAFKAALRGKRAPLVAPIDNPHEFLFVPDAGPVLVALALDPRARGGVYNLGGAGVTSQRALASLAFAGTGHRFRALAIGPMLMRAGGVFDPVLRELVEVHYLHTTPLIVDDSALRALLGPLAKTSYEEGVRRTIESLAGYGDASHVRAATAGARP